MAREITCLFYSYSYTIAKEIICLFSTYLYTIEREITCLFLLPHLLYRKGNSSIFYLLVPNGKWNNLSYLLINYKKWDNSVFYLLVHHGGDEVDEIGQQEDGAPEVASCQFVDDATDLLDPVLQECDPPRHDVVALATLRLEVILNPTVCVIVVVGGRCPL